MTHPLALSSASPQSTGPQRPRPIVRAGFLAAMLLLAGCVRKETEGDLTIYSFETWVGVTMILVGLGAAAGCVYLWRTGGRMLWLLAIGVLLAILLGPAMFLDYVVIDNEHFATRWGLWFSPVEHDVRFDDIAGIDHTKEVRSGRRGRKETTYYLVITMKDGLEHKIATTGELMSVARSDVFRVLKEHGLTINDRTGD